MMWSSFNGNFLNISCYSFTNASDETDIITFYNELSSLVWHIPRHNNLIIAEAMNTQIGKDKNNIFCLIEMVNRLACLNTKFQIKG